MAELLCGEDPEPSERVPAGPLYVPVRPGHAGCAVRLFRTPIGGGTAVGFTTRDRLAATLGPDQPWIRLAEPALRALVQPLGVATVTVDPQFWAPAATRESPPAADGSADSRREWDERTTGVLGVTGAVTEAVAGAVVDASVGL
ncbi:SAV_915 family protein [Streptomyces sp. NPDC055036]